MYSERYSQILTQIFLLDKAEQQALLDYLQMSLASVTREQLLAEHEQLRAAGAFEGVESLRNKYAQPGENLDFLETEDNTLAQEWQRKIDDLFK